MKKKSESKRGWVGQLRVLSDLLGLCDKHAPTSVLMGWTGAQCKSAEAWAVATHLRASDNIVRVPPMPKHVAKLEAWSAVADRIATKRGSESA